MLLGPCESVFSTEYTEFLRADADVEYTEFLRADADVVSL